MTRGLLTLDMAPDRSIVCCGPIATPDSTLITVRLRRDSGGAITIEAMTWLVVIGGHVPTHEEAPLPDWAAAIARDWIEDAGDSLDYLAEWYDAPR